MTITDVLKNYPNTIGDWLTLPECKPYWEPDGHLVFPCGLRLAMDLALGNGQWYGQVLTYAHQRHHDHDRSIHPWTIITSHTVDKNTAQLTAICECLNR